MRAGVSVTTLPSLHETGNKKDKNQVGDGAFVQHTPAAVQHAAAWAGFNLIHVSKTLCHRQNKQYAGFGTFVDVCTPTAPACADQVYRAATGVLLAAAAGKDARRLRPRAGGPLAPTARPLASRACSRGAPR